jgi:hypothetical protein
MSRPKNVKVKVVPFSERTDVTIQPSRGLLIKIGQSAVEENLESIRRRDSVFSASGEVTAEAAENLGAFHGTKTA